MRFYGENHPHAKVREQEVLELRQKWNNLSKNLLSEGEEIKGWKFRFCNYHKDKVRQPVTWAAINEIISHRDWRYLDEGE